MAQGKTITITKIKENNNKTATTVPSTAVETEVVDGQLVPSRSVTDKGVVQ